MKHTDIRRKDIAALSHTALVDLVWTLTKEANEAVETFGEGYDEPRDLCVMTPDQILSHIETKAEPDRFAWAKKATSTAGAAS